MRWQTVLTAAATASLLAACGGGSTPGSGETSAAPTPAVSGSTSPQGGQDSSAPAAPQPERLDVDFVGDGATQHKLDLFLPKDAGSGPFPLVVWVHGGGWKGGDKSDIGRAEDIQMVQTKDLLLSKGYAVAAPNYRLIPNTTFPEPMQDVAASVRYLRAHAAEFGLDAERFALMGDSAGAHLAAMTAMTPSKADLQGDLGETSGDAHVRAFVGYYGIYDLTKRSDDQQAICGGGKRGMESSHGRLIGADPDSPEGRPVAEKASPVTYAAADSPAVLLFSGRADCTAPYPQAERFAQAVKDAGGTSEVTIIDKSHGDAQFFTDPAIHQQLITFLDGHVKN